MPTNASPDADPLPSTANATTHNGPRNGQTAEGDFPPEESNIWTTKEMRVLKKHVQPYKDTSKSSKADYIQNTVIPELQATWDHRYSRRARKEDKQLHKEWKVKKHRIFNWFRNHASNRIGVKLEGLNSRITFQTVFREEKSAEIDSEVALLSGNAARRSKDWMKFYQQGRKQVEARLTQEERDRFMEILEEWNKKGVSKSMKAKTAARQGRKILRQMEKLKWQRMGMRSITFEGHYDIEGKIEYSMTQTSDLALDDVRIPSFGQLFPSELAAFRRAFVQYLVHISEIEKGVANPALPDASFHEKSLKFSSNGFPIVPSPIYGSTGREVAYAQKSIIRIYMNKVYALAKDRPGSSVPWDALERRSAEMIDPEYWPSSIPVTDPSRLRLESTSAILKLWRDRQAQGDIPFKFSKVFGNGYDIMEPLYPSNLFDGLEAHPIPPPPAAITKRRLRQKAIRLQTQSSSDSESSNLSEFDNGRGSPASAMPRTTARFEVTPETDETPTDAPSRSSEPPSLPSRSSPTIVNPSSSPTPEVEEAPPKPARKIMPRKRTKPYVGTAEMDGPDEESSVPPPVKPKPTRRIQPRKRTKPYSDPLDTVEEDGVQTGTTQDTDNTRAGRDVTCDAFVETVTSPDTDETRARRNVTSDALALQEASLLAVAGKRQRKKTLKA
ncbi:hypothetical protein JR316_0010149 [Psilocybe cubensis]|uniref:Uncharacterized protein n=2 Tax=Psilocybe cubensis TaxID=181762 RepID=A0A8H8CFW4_PSICU|nr:hypothetical protein JR316_0010149 [Psilocybe cubensis]KAH9477917.1 hypothetical protein JR316_0010149 [Psilocybe cubensis]